MGYFSDIYRSRGVHDLHRITDLIQPRVTAAMNQRLMQPFSEKEVREALMQMHPSKAPGPDGMPALFFQHFWHLVGKDVAQFMLNLLRGNADMDTINHTLIALIPKVKAPSSRRISDPSVCVTLSSNLSRKSWLID